MTPGNGHLHLAVRDLDVELAVKNLFEGHPSGETKAALRYADVRVLQKIAADYLAKEARGDSQFTDIDLKRSDALPRILAGLHRYFGGDAFFRRFGVEMEAFYVTGMDKDTLEVRNVQAKEAFNSRIDQYIRDCHHYWQETTDYDILGKATVLTDGQRPAYQRTGTRRLAALQHAAKINKADIRVCMRVFEENLDPYAVDSARVLVENGVKVHNHDDGQKFIAMLISSAAPDWQKRVKEAGFDEQRLEAETDLPKETVKDMLEGKIPAGYFEIREIERVTGLPIVVNTPVAATIYRDFETAGTIAGEPQVHRFFYGMVFRGWPGLFNHIRGHVEHHATETNRVTPEMLQGKKEKAAT
jgi:hypothetical protein